MLALGLRTTAVVLLSLVYTAKANDCTTAKVGSPYSNCYDIAVAAGINTNQLIQYNPGLDCALLQLGQELCVTVGDLPNNAPKPNSDGSCATYTTISDDSCSLIGTKFGITAAQIEQFNVNTYKWKGCSLVQVGYTLCVSSGTPPPIPVNPALQCGPESPGAAECPLKACCSAFGFCGMSSEFCEPASNGDPCISNCGYGTIPSCDGSQLTRNVGYYAGWSADRSCNPVQVSQLDLSSLTHVIYAFATISEDMTIGFANSSDGDRLKQLVTKAGSAVKVMAAVGGWTFSQGSTKDLFSVMIGTSANRATFIASAKSFISTYKIAGIDIDFEYPASIERGGPPTDTPNLTLFFQELRSGLGDSALISLATPAGYWFLKGFELDKIAPELSFFNMMSYDYHGPWDTTVTGANSTAQPQSSVLDMKDSVKLYTKAGVDMKDVNLGLAWYGRSFALEDKSCAGYNCDMTGGGTPGDCTGESGVLANYEINQVLIDADARPKWDKSTQTKWFIGGGDLITYDDADTLAAKTEFAKNSCFGGTMIWSIDQNVPKDNAVPGLGISLEMKSSASNPFGAVWEVPNAGTCKSYGTRIYTSRLWHIPGGTDWIEACKASPITIGGVTYDAPDDCDDRGAFGGVIGSWYVSSDDTHCLPHWGDFEANDCVDNTYREWYSRLWDIAGGVDWMTMCKSTPAHVSASEIYFEKPYSCDDKGILGAYGIWHLEDTSCAGNWGDLKDNGCSDTIGKREWSAKLFDITASWEDACASRDATVEDEYFSTPDACEKHITGIWGVWDTMDPTCGVPPCPDDKVWDFESGACMDCSGTGKLLAARQTSDYTRSLDAEVQPKRASASFSSKQGRRRHLLSNSTLPTRTLQKRVGECFAFHLPRPTPSYFPNNPLAWLDNDGNGGSAAEGPTAADIASNTGAQAAFQEAWNDSFPTANTAQEVGGWIYADPSNPRRIFIRRAQRNRANSMNRSNPPAVAAGIDLNNPESNPGRPAPAGWVLVANFHTHPMGDAYGGNPAIPSAADNTNAWYRGVPGIIIHGNGLTGYGPNTRALLVAPRGYPNSNYEYNGQGSSGSRLGTWTPDPAPRQ